MPTFRVVFADADAPDDLVIADEVVLRMHSVICHQFQDRGNGSIRRPVLLVAQHVVAQVVEQDFTQELLF